MSQPAEPPEASETTTRDEERPEPATFTLMVVSPSVGVPGPLNFPHLQASTTVKDLKAKIRDVLPSKPADGSQRLIHRGRMLGVETETMSDIFGQETLRNAESQTLHLVLRPVDGTSTTSSSTPIPLIQPTAMHPNPLLFQPPRPASTPAVPLQGMHAQLPLPGFPQLQQHQVLHQYEHLQNVMNQRLQHLQRETQRLHQEIGNMELRHRSAMQSHPGIPASHGLPIPHPLAVPYPPVGIRAPQAIPPSVQALINQQQRERAAEGRHGAQSSGHVTPQGGPTRPTSSGRNSPGLHRPEHSTTYSREGIGPNGERWHVTVNETTSTFPAPHVHPHPHPSHHPQPNPALDVQAVLRNADRFLASQTLLNNMQRIASNSSQAPAEPSSTGQAPIIPGTNSASPAPNSTTMNPSASNPFNPAMTANIPAAGFSSQRGNTTMAASANVEPMVYILSSPQGPRALLLHNSGTFFTPRQRRYQAPLPNGVTPPPMPQDGQARGLPQPWDNRMEQRAARRAHRQRRGNNAVEPVDAAHANPGAGALAAQLAPYLWLVIRLIGFIWFFSMGNPSWARFLMVSGLAFLVFLYNTGLFNGVAEGFWGPVRRHLEGLIPLAGPDAALVPAANAAVHLEQPAAEPAADDGRPRRRHGELDPAEVAARLIEQRRQADGGRLMAQLRRVERSFLLFLASLVPGVGERHIAAREAEEVERQRRIEAAAAAEDQEGGNPEPVSGEGDANGVVNTSEEGGPPAAAERQEEPGQAQPLIQI